MVSGVLLEKFPKVYPLQNPCHPLAFILFDAMTNQGDCGILQFTDVKYGTGYTL